MLGRSANLFLPKVDYGYGLRPRPLVAVGHRPTWGHKWERVSLPRQ